VCFLQHPPQAGSAQVLAPGAVHHLPHVSATFTGLLRGLGNPVAFGLGVVLLVCLLVMPEIVPPNADLNRLCSSGFVHSRYPRVSSMMLSFFVCRSINDTSYLVADFSETCGSKA
jgi:hypothetical protein